jgi:hypothetical protein
MSAYHFQLESGHRYYSGMELPWYVSKSMVTAELAKKGFVEIVWHERSKDALPKTVEPAKLCKGYSDDWDLWVVATYAGPTGVGSLPAKPAWIMHAVRGVPLQPKTEEEESDDDDKPSGSGASSVGSTVLTVLGIVTGLLTIRKLVK